MTSYYVGLDLGQMSDFSAIVAIEAATVKDPETNLGVLDLTVRGLYRWPLGTPYPQIVSDTRAQLAEPPLCGRSSLFVDETGVGKAVVDMFREADLPATLEAYSITAGLKPGDGTVPKKDLVAAVVAVLGRRLKFAAGLELGPVIEKELQTFRTKITPDRNEQFASWREKDKDDLVLALALAVWGALRDGPADISPRPSGPVEPPYPACFGADRSHPGGVESRPWARG